jgi:hypothetical protein
MVQPKYSPEEALQRIKLMMEYDSSKTLDENKEMISEQTAGNVADPLTLGYGATGAAYGATLAGGGIAAATAAGATMGSVFPVVGTAIGALAGVGVGMLMQWYSNKDYGKSGFEQVMSACKSSGASKLVPKMSKSETRAIAYSIEDAKGQWNDDEDAIASALQKIESIADLCAVDKKVTGGLLEFLDNLTDSPDEWKMFTRPLAGMIEDTEVVLTPEEQKKSKGIPGDAGPARKKTSKYKSCSGTYSYGCKANAIAEVQGCLGLTTDGKFGPKTKSALSGKGFTTFTDKDITKICSTTTIEKPKDEFTTQVDADNVEDILNM